MGKQTFSPGDKIAVVSRDSVANGWSGTVREIRTGETGEWIVCDLIDPLFPNDHDAEDWPFRSYELRRRNNPQKGVENA